MKKKNKSGCNGACAYDITGENEYIKFAVCSRCGYKANLAK